MIKGKADLLVAVNISTPERSEIFSKATGKSLSLTTKDEMHTNFYGPNVLGLRGMYFSKNDEFMGPERFRSINELLETAGRPIWDYLWENKSTMETWTEYNLIFREIFENKDGEKFILVFKFIENDWTFDFKKLEEYRFAEKDHIVCVL